MHEAFFYEGDTSFVDGVAAFARDAIDADEPILVMVGARKIDALRAALGPAAASVQFANMEDVGANPARIIPAWRAFVAAHDGHARVRGVGEPIWLGRDTSELTESQQHEALLNIAFANTRGMWLVCPYDRAALDPGVIDEAAHSHPLLSAAHVGDCAPSPDYDGTGAIAGAALAGALPDPPGDATTFSFGIHELPTVRALVRERAARAGLVRADAESFVVAANEAATNSVRHAGGRGTLRVWSTDASVVAEVRDPGHIDDPLAGRVPPARADRGGAGLYIANQFCDLVQLRSSGAGTVVRLHKRVR